MKKLLLILAASGSLLLAGCGQKSTQSQSSENTQKPTMVKVGVIAPLSGPAATIGEDAVNTFTMAAEQFNKTHSGIQIQLIIEDGKCDGKDATSAAQKLVNVDNVKIILGGVCSSETLAASKITQPAGVVLLSAVSSSPEISKISDYTYRYYNDINQAATMKAYLEKQGTTKIALIYENTDYGVGFAKALTNALGSENVLVDQKFNTDEKDFSVIAKQVTDKKADIQAIVYIPNNDSSSINVVRALDNEELIEEFKGRILTSEAGYSSTTVKELGSKMDSILTSQLPDAEKLSSNAETFVKEFSAIHTPKFAEVFLILYKESFDLLTRGLTDPQYGPTKINDYIGSITKDQPTSGLIGSYYFNGVDVVGVSFVMKRIENGKLVAIQ